MASRLALVYLLKFKGFFEFVILLRFRSGSIMVDLSINIETIKCFIVAPMLCCNTRLALALVTHGFVKWNSAHLRLPAASVPSSPLPV